MLHWMLWNIPATATQPAAKRVPPASQLPDGTRQISATGPYYRGPGAPASGPAHHYVFELLALDATLERAGGRRVAAEHARGGSGRGDGGAHPRQGGLRGVVQAPGRDAR